MMTSSICRVVCLRTIYIGFVSLIFLAAPIGAAADTLSLTFNSASRFPVFESGQEVQMDFFVRRDNPAKPDKIIWKVQDYLGNEVKAGQVVLSGGEPKLATAVTLSQLPSGYLEVHARLQNSGVELSRQGSRPAGMATFGILSPLAPLTPANLDDSRFGVQGTNFIKSGVFMQGDPYAPLYQALGVKWVNLSRDWAQSEPDRPGQYAEALKQKAAQNNSGEDYMNTDQLAPLVCASFLPWWSIDFPAELKVDKSDGFLKQAYPPKDLGLYAEYMKLLSADFAAMRKQSYPKLKSSYYQVGWEPDWHWKGTPEQFVNLYTAAYKGLHAGDPDAVVLGPGYGVMSKGVQLLEQLLPMGLGKSLDGIAIHGYYLPFGDPRAKEITGKYVSPEKGGLIESMRKLRGLMKQYLKPGAKLFQTEWGLDYRSRYLDLDPNLLRLQAAYIIRGHLIFLGEGCDVTYFFYTADYGNLEHPGEDGYGLCFNLTMPTPSFGATTVSPKPVFMAATALTRVLEGTKTIGAVDTGDDSICAYLFRRNEENVLVIWTRDGSTKKVKISVISEKITYIDFMGNTSAKNKKDGGIEITVNEYPAYYMGVAANPFLSTNASNNKKN